MARAARPVSTSVREASGAKRPARVTSYIDPSRIRPRQPVTPTIEGGTRSLTRNEQLGYAQPLVTNKKPSGVRQERPSREARIAAILEIVANNRR